MTMSMRFGAAFCAALLMSGCATVTRGTKQKFEITSLPSGASVSTTTGISCVTPCHLKIKRKPGFVATLSKAGYKTAKVSVSSDMHKGGTTGLAGNAIAGGLIGIVVDAGNGSLNDLRPNPLSVTLEAESPAATAEPIAAAPASVAPAAPAVAAPAEPPKP